MPLFEYVCEACGRKSEVLQRIADPPLETCPECGGRLRKLLSAPAFQFKGSGWYVTDYAKKGASEGKGTRGGDSGGDSGGGDSGGEAAASSKSESTSGGSAAAKESAPAPAAKPTPGSGGKD